MPEIYRHPSDYVKGSVPDRLTTLESDADLTGGRRPVRDGDEPGMRAELYPDTLLRDLERLFNATSPLGLSDSGLLRKYPHAASSVLGYGLRGILGRVVHDPGEIEEQVRNALATFEPRLVVEEISLKVSQEGRLLEIEIKGLLLAQRAKRQLWVRTNLETLESKLETKANG